MRDDSLFAFCRLKLHVVMNKGEEWFIPAVWYIKPAYFGRDTLGLKSIVGPAERKWSTLSYIQISWSPMRM